MKKRDEMSPIENKEGEEEIGEEKEIEEMLVEDTEEEVEYSGVFFSQPSEKKENIKGKEYLVSEFSLLHEEKKLLEHEVFGESEKLKEKQWEKTAQENLDDIEKSIDEGVIEKVAQRERKKKEDVEVEMTPPEGDTVYGRVITREVVYETPGGYVVKVVYKEGDDVKTSYYSVSKLRGIEHSLDEIKAYRPIIKPSMEEISVANKEEQKEGKTFIQRLLGKQ
jgi:hypothetical protein